MEYTELQNKMIHEMEGKFDAGQILSDYSKACLLLGHFPLQMNVNCPEEMVDVKEQLSCMPGTNWDYSANEAMIEEARFTRIAEPFQGSYTETVIEELKESYKLGRIRFLTLAPRTNYSWHKDVEEMRLHIPLKTTLANFFIWQEGPTLMADRMRNAGSVYLFHTKCYHTAVNGDNETRVHLVLNVI